MIADEKSAEEGMIRNTISLENSVKNYHHWNLSVFPVKKKRRFLEIGCGAGLYLDAIMKYEPDFYLATDFSPHFLKMARERMGAFRNCQAEHLDILSDEIPGVLSEQRFDYTLCFDVIEHLSDDIKALEKIKKIMTLTGNGLLFLRVPALPMIYVKNDEVIGHYRRYTLKSLRYAIEKAGLGVSKIQYQNIAGVLPWWIIGRLFQRSLAVAPNEGKIFDAAVPLLRRFEKIFPPPMGLSIYCIATT